MKDIPDKSAVQKIELLKDRQEQIRESLQGKEETKEEDLRTELRNLEQRIRYLREDEESDLETTTINENTANEEEQVDVNTEPSQNYNEEETNDYNTEQGPSVSDPVRKLNKEIREAYEEKIEGPKYKGPKY